MSRRFLPVLMLLISGAPALGDSAPLPLDNLPDPDPLLLEHTVQLQRNIYTSSLELQYARNLDQLCKAQPGADRCEEYEPGQLPTPQQLPGATQSNIQSPAFASGSAPPFQQTQTLQPVQLAPKLPIVEEVSGSGDRLTAVLLLPTGERRVVKQGDRLDGIGTITSLDRSGVTLTTRSGSTRLGGGR